jgi:ribosomal protein S17
MQTKNKHTLTVRIANSPLVPKYSRTITETDTFNAYTNNEKKLKSSVGSRSSCSTCDTGDVTLVRNLMIGS